VFTLQVIWFAEAWYWASLTMVIGVLTLEVLRKERAAGFQVLTGAAGQDQDADQVSAMYSGSSSSFTPQPYKGCFSVAQATWLFV
jgi:hypothetical protein